MRLYLHYCLIHTVRFAKNTQHAQRTNFQLRAADHAHVIRTVSSTDPAVWESMTTLHMEEIQFKTQGGYLVYLIHIPSIP